MRQERGDERQETGDKRQDIYRVKGYGLRVVMGRRVEISGGCVIGDVGVGGRSW